MKFQNENCSGNDNQSSSIILAFSVTGGIGTLLALLVVIVLVCIGAYKSVLQRLFLWGVFSTVLHEAVHFASIEQRFKYTGDMWVCSALGFLNSWTEWVVCDFHVCIVGYLLCIVFYQLKGNQFCFKTKSPLRRRLLEVVCVVLCVALPAAILCPPFLIKMYRRDESWCWTRPSDKDCNSTDGMVDKFIYGYLFYEVVGILAFITTIVIIIMYCMIASKFGNIRQLLRHTMILSLAIVIFMVLLNLMLMVDLRKFSFNGQLYFSVAVTMKDLIFLIGYLLTFYGPKCFKKRVTTQKSPQLKAETGKEYGTFKESDRVSAPSSTFFDIQFTGAFTSVTD